MLIKATAETIIDIIPKRDFIVKITKYNALSLNAKSEHSYSNVYIPNIVEIKPTQIEEKETTYDAVVFLTTEGHSVVWKFDRKEQMLEVAYQLAILLNL